MNTGPVARRVALTLGAAVLGTAIASRNWAQNNEVNVQFHAFQDTRSVTVLSPSVDLNKDFTDRSTIRVNYGLDVISAASDSCARCHREGVNSHRQVFGASLSQKFDALRITVGGAYSTENFYRATTALASASRDLGSANTTIAGGYTFSLNQPTLHPNQQVENQYSNDAFASLTQTLSKTTIVQGGYEINKLNGYLDNPFLRANVNGELILGHVPDARTRQTVMARLRQALPASTFLEADYRHYFDEWQVVSNAISVGVSHRFMPELFGSLAYRHYDQTGAYFYAPAYGGNPEFYTADFRLEPFSSGLYTATLMITPNGSAWLVPRGAGLLLQYERYRADNGFDAEIISVGMRVPLKAR
jgi:uncharacterized protein DUF3570